MKFISQYISTITLWSLALSLLMPQASMAQSTNQNYREVVNSRIIEQVNGLNDLSEIDVLDFELSNEPSNLYLGMLNLSGNEVHRQALEATSVVTGQSIFAVRDIIENNGNFDFGIPPAQTQALIGQIQNIYTEEKLLAELAIETTASQFFFERYTNAIDDAEFDLITDLQLIHELLFTERPPTYIESDPSKRGRNPFRDSHLGRLRDLVTSQNSASPTDGSTGGQAGEGTGVVDEGTSAEVNEVDSGNSDDSFCPVDPELAAMVSAYNETFGSQPVSDSDENEDNFANNDPRDNNDSGAGNNTNVNGEGSGFTTRSIASRFQQDNSPFPCEEGQFFCVEIIKEFARTKNYFPGDSDCTACRISRINQQLTNNVLKKNLSPGKVTGNFGELAECKEAYINLPLNLNVRFEGKPIIKQDEDLISDLANPEVRSKSNQILSKLNNQDIDQLVAARVAQNNANLVDIGLKAQQRLDELGTNLQTLSLASSDSQKVNFYKSLNTDLLPQIQGFNQMLRTTTEQLTFMLRTFDEFISNPSCNG